MASITDCVSEGLKYPFNNVKKLLGLGVLFVIFELLSIAFSIKTFDIFRVTAHMLEKTNGHWATLKLSQLPNIDVNIAIGLLVAGFIVSLFIMGYQYNVIKFSIDKKEDLPGFSDIVGMFINGVKYFIVSVVYNLPPVIIMFLGIWLVGDSSVLPIILLISGLVLVICYFFLVMALNNMIAHDSLKKAFDFNEIIANISNLGWVKYIGIILFTIIVFMIINMAVGCVLSLLVPVFAATINNQALVVSTFITILEALFLSSYCSVFYNRVCGSIYRESIK